MDTHHAFAELGLDPGATAHEVKAAWRRLVSQWHPDRNDSAGAVARMQRINDAFRVIRGAGWGGSPEAAPTAGSASPPPRPEAASAWQAPGSGSGSQRQSAQASAPARTVHRRVRLTLEEAAAGCTKVLQGRMVNVCAGCEGRGHRLPEATCEPCEGSGQVRQTAWFGWVSARTNCEACAGSGRVPRECTDCHGSGKLDSLRYHVATRIAHGVRSGDLLHVKPQRPRPGEVAVDLHLHVEVSAHPLFTLDDDGTVRCEMPVDGFAWIANRTLNVPTLNGLQPLTLNREQRVYRLDGQGFPTQRRGARGDLVITVQPVFPERLSTDQDILLDQLLAASLGPDGVSNDPRLARWQRDLGTWRAEQQRRDSDTAR